MPTNPIGAEYPPLAIAAFGLVAAFGLGLTWHAGERLRDALDAAGREITARARAERAASEAATTLELVIASSPVATMAVDANGNVAIWNAAAERLFGWAREEVAGRPLPLVVEPKAGEPPIAMDGWITRALAPGHTAEPVRVLTRDGGEVLVELHAARRPETGGRHAAQAAGGIIVQAVDVTARVALEAQLRQAQRMEAVGHLAGGVAHDINNALTAVAGFAELIETESGEPDVRKDAAMIGRAVERGTELTRRLLAFARRSVLQPQVIDVGEYVASLRPSLARHLGAGVALEIRDEAAGARANVDPEQLEQALLNLASNASDAMPSGGALSIVVARRQRENRVDGGGDGSEEASAPAEPPAPGAGIARIVVTMSDTGAGIPVELQDRVFEPFFTTKERGKGTGLGLAMVYGFVTQSGGEVSLRSTPGQGTTVEIALAEVSDEPAAPGEVPSSGERQGSETILVVEDEPDVAALADRVLTARGYDVLVAQNGEQALEQARRRVAPIDLIVSDVIMPGMAGPDVVRAVRQVHPEAGVVYASGYSADVIAQRGVLPAGVALIQKPYTPTQLVERVRSALDAKDPAQ